MKLSLPAFLLAASAAAKERDVFHARNTANRAIRRRVQHAAEMGSLEDIDVTVSRLNSPETPRRELGIFGEVKAFGPDGICADGDEYGTLNLTQPYEPLRKPTQFYPDTDGVTRVTLKYEPIQYHGPSYSNIIRAWNNEVPGPTIHLQEGGRLELELINCHRRPDGAHGELWHNDYAVPNTTNIHTHGPHISGESPGDNIFINVGPENKTTYKYEFDRNHLPGTFWYHPHKHGSVALQVAQGAAGMMIINDNDVYPLPDDIKDMEEIQMVVQHMNLERLRESSAVSLDNITYWREDSLLDHDPFKVTNITTDLTNFMLVNMQFLPKVTMKLGKWYRWRMVMSSVLESVAFHPGSDACEMKLLAKDSIYLSDAPRDISMVILSPGNRADVAVRCNSLGLQYMNVSEDSASLYPELGNFDGNFNPGKDQYDPLVVPGQEPPPVEHLMGSFSDPNAQPTLLVIDVVKGDDLSEFGKDLNKPCYLADLTDERVDAMFERGGEAEHNTFTNAYSCVLRSSMPDYDDQFEREPRDPPEVSRVLCGVGGPYGVGGNTTVGITFEEAYLNGGLIPWVNDTIYMNSFDTGTVQQIKYIGAQVHPHHQHVNPYQITKIESVNATRDFVNEYYKVGDWHDVLQFPSTGAVNVTFRFQADQFTGHMVQHCHILFHEDWGMMTQYDITGKEGAIWEYARVLNPQCILPQNARSKASKR